MSTRFNEFDTIWAPPDTAVDDNGAEFSSIQNAVDNASSVVLVGPGTFSESVTITTSGLTLIGVGPGTVVDGGTGTGISIEAVDVTVSSLAVQTDSGSNDTDAISLSSSAHDAVIENIVIKDAGRHGISIENSNRVQVVGASIRGCDENGIGIGANTRRAQIGNVVIRSGVGNNGIDDGGNFTQIDTIQIDSVGNHGIVSSGNDGVITTITIFSAGGDGVKTTGKNQTVVSGRVSQSGGSDTNFAGDTTSTAITTVGSEQVIALSETVGTTTPGNRAPTIIDSFEDGNISADPAWSGTTGDWTVVNNPSYGAINGTHVLENAPNAGGDITVDPTAFTKGNIAHIYYRHDVSGDRLFVSFGLKDANNRYDLSILTSDIAKIEKVAGGTRTELARQTGFGWDSGTWYRFEILWNDGSIDPASDPAWNSSTTSGLGSDGDLAWAMFSGVSGPGDGTEEANSPLTANDLETELQDEVGIGLGPDDGSTTTHTIEYINVP